MLSPSTRAFNESAAILLRAAEEMLPTCFGLSWPSWVAPKVSIWLPVMPASCVVVTAARWAASRPARVVPPSAARPEDVRPPIWAAVMAPTLAGVSLPRVVGDSRPNWAEVSWPATAFSDEADMLASAPDERPPTCLAFRAASCAVPKPSTCAPVMAASCPGVTPASRAGERPANTVAPSAARFGPLKAPICAAPRSPTAALPSESVAVESMATAPAVRPERALVDKALTWSPDMSAI